MYSKKREINKFNGLCEWVRDVRQEVPPMAHMQFADLRSRPTEFVDFTSLTLDEFQLLIPPFEVAFQAHIGK